MRCGSGEAAASAADEAAAARRVAERSAMVARSVDIWERCEERGVRAIGADDALLSCTRRGRAVRHRDRLQDRGKSHPA